MQYQEQWQNEQEVTEFAFDMLVAINMFDGMTYENAVEAARQEQREEKERH